MSYVEPGGSWRPLWLVAGVLVLLVVLDLVLPGPDVPTLVEVLAGVAVLGVVAAGVVSARRAWTVRVDAVDGVQDDAEPEDPGDQPERPPGAPGLVVRHQR